MLIVGSNCIVETGNRPQRYKKFLVNIQELFSARQITAMTTLTLNTIYKLGKKANRVSRKFSITFNTDLAVFLN